MRPGPPTRCGTWLAACGLIGALAETARACAVCYGDPESDMGRGAVWGVAFLAVVVATVLAGIATVAVCWMVKARRATPRLPGADTSAASCQPGPGTLPKNAP